MAGQAVNDRGLVDHVRDLPAQGEGLAGMTSGALVASDLGLVDGQVGKHAGVARVRAQLVQA